MSTRTDAAQSLLDQVVRDAPDSVVEAVMQVLVAGAKPQHIAFTARALRAIALLADEVDPERLEAAAAAATDYEVLVRGLEQLPARPLLDADQTDPLGVARLRGVRKRQELLAAEGGAVTADEAAALLGLTRQAVDLRRRKGRLIGLTLGRRGYAYPSWQFGSAGTLPGLESVLGDLTAHDPWMQLIFMLTPNVRLDGETPLAELRRGNVKCVQSAARAYGEHGAD